MLRCGSLPRRDPAPRGHVRLLAIAMLAGGLLVSVSGLAAVSAADPFVAGQPAARSLATPPDGGRSAIATARHLAASVGVSAPAAAAAARLVDRLESSTYDEVTFRDPRDRPTLIVRVHPDGSLRHLVRLDAPSPGPAMPEAQVVPRGVAVAVATGLSPQGTPAVRRDPASGWAIAWPRTEGGVEVAGDGIWVRLDPDGSARSVARTESQLATRPPALLDEPQARAAAERHLTGLVSAESRGQVAIADARLAWVAPNDTFTPSRPDAPEPVRRLAWVVRVTTSGPLAERLRGLEVDIDAGSGELLGGDTLE